MIESLLDACQFVLEDQGEPQSTYMAGITGHGNEVVAGQ
jgi:hypothetical protein